MKKSFIVAALLWAYGTVAQELTNKGSRITIPSGNTVTVVGSISTISSGAITNNGTLQMSGDWMHDGTLLYSGAGTLELNGSGAQILTGTTLYNLLLSGSGTKTTSATSIITNDLNFTGPSVLNTSTNSDTLVLGSAGTLSETASGYIDGWIRTTRTVAQNIPNTFGGLGLTLTANGASPGSSVVTRGTGTTAIQSGSGNLGVARVFRVEPSVNAGLNADLVFAYRDGELNALSESNLVLFRSTDGGSNWSYLGQVARDATANTLTMTGINSFGKLTLGSSTSPLPLTWISFAGQPATTGNLLQWVTANEASSSYFEVERSGNGNDYFSIGRVEAAGFTSGDRHYSYTDPKTISDWYYRLKQVDRDGRFSYSATVRISRKEAAGLGFTSYPNPFADQVKLRFSKPLDEATKLQVALLNEGGGVLLRQEATIAANQTELRIGNLGALPKGIYFITISSSAGQNFLLRLQH